MATMMRNMVVVATITLLSASPAAALNWTLFTNEAQFAAATQNLAIVRARASDAGFGGAPRPAGGYDFFNQSPVLTTFDPPGPRGAFLSYGLGGGLAYNAYPRRFAPTALGVRLITQTATGDPAPGELFKYSLFLTGGGPFVQTEFTAVGSSTRFIGIVADGALDYFSLGASRIGGGPGIEDQLAVMYSHALIGGVQLAVPEPDSWALLIAGFGMIGAVQRRRSAMPQR